MGSFFLFGQPIWMDADAADEWRDDREDKNRINEKGRTDRTALRCSDGACGVEAVVSEIKLGQGIGNAYKGAGKGLGTVIDSAGNAVGNIGGSFGQGLTSGLLGPIPLVAAGVIGLVGIAYAIKLYKS